MFKFFKELNRKRLNARGTIPFTGSTSEAIARQIQISEQHLKVFPKFKNCCQGKSLALVATGASLKKFNPAAFPNLEYVGVNTAIDSLNVYYKYYFVQDYGVLRYLGTFEKFKKNGTNFFGRNVSYDKRPRAIIPEFEYENCNAKLYYTSNPFNYFQYDISTNALPDFRSVVFSAVSFMLWTRPKEIYLIGCDCSSSYADGRDKKYGFTDLVEVWQQLKQFAEVYYPDSKIISINPIGLKGIFIDQFTD